VNIAYRPIHSDFRVRNNEWSFNRRSTPGRLSLKVRFSFTEPHLLDDCPFYAKVGENRDRAIVEPYIGFAYAREEEKSALLAWVRRFPFAELIEGLDRNSASTIDSMVTKIV